MASASDRQDALHHLTTDTGDAFATDKAKGSHYFIELAKKGEDISDAVPGLIETYFITHQVPAMDPAAEALSRHWVNRGEMEPLLKMISEVDYTNSFSKALEKIAEEGGNLIPAIPVLVALLPADEYLIAHAAAAFCRKNPAQAEEFLTKISKAALAGKKSRKYFFRLCKEIQYKGGDIKPLIPRFVELLADSARKKDAATTLHWLVEPGADLTSIEAGLRPYLQDKSTDVQFSIAYVLAFHYLNQQRFTEFDNLLSDAKEDVIQGLVHALGVKLLSKNDGAQPGDILIRVVKFLDHGTRKIADRALSICEQAAQKGRLVQLPGDILAGLRRKEQNQNIRQFLYRYAESMGMKTAESDAEPLCKTCQKIKRRESYSSESSVPEEFNRFKALGYPTHGNAMSLYTCPDCGMFYEYSYDSEWDDMSQFTTILLYRMNTIEVRAILPADKIAEHEPTLSRLEKLWAGRVGHPVLWARQEAAWITGEVLMKNQRWSELEIFFRDSAEIRKEISALLIKYSLVYPRDAELRKLLTTKLSGDNAGIEYDLAKSLAQIYRANRENQSFLDFLQSPNEMLQLAALHVLWLAARENYGVGSFAGILRMLSRGKNVEVRRYARFALDEGRERGEITEDQDSLEHIVEDLHGEDDEKADEACDTLEKLSENQSIEKFLPELIPLLKNKERAYGAHSVIKKALHREHNISSVIPALLELAADRKYSNRADILWTIQEAQQTGHDVSAGKKLFLDSLGESRLQSTAIELVRGLFDAGKIGERDLPPIQKLMQKRTSDGYSEAACYIVFEFYRGKKDYKRMAEMLSHENRSVRGPSCSRLAEQKEKIGEAKRFLDILVENMTDKGWYVRVCSGSCLEKYAKLGKKEKLEVQQLVGKIPANKKNKELEELRSAIGGLGE